MLDELFGGPVSGIRKCLHCNMEISGKPEKLYCDRKCKRAASYVRNGNAKTAAERDCGYCGASFKRKPDPRYSSSFCSKACSGASIMEEVVISAILSGEMLAPIARFTVLRRHCERCGSMFTAANRLSRLCFAGPCRSEEANIKAVKYAAANDNREHDPRPCTECAAMFTTSYGDKRSMFCSAKCRKRSASRLGKSKRRAVLRQAFVESVNPIKVFDRDKWTCRICGVKTPRSKRGTYDDDAPELDHIMPLALGGAHSYMNTQCACRKCNADKSDTPPMQTSLFAYAS